MGSLPQLYLDRKGKPKEAARREHLQFATAATPGRL
jgi:hypothetical protein